MAREHPERAAALLSHKGGSDTGIKRNNETQALLIPSREEIQEVKDEGNLEVLFNSLDKIVEEAKNREEPAWRPSGIPEEDVRSAMVPYLLKHRSYLRKVLKEKEEENRTVAESVLAGRYRIAELQQLIQARKRAWQAISKEQRELIMTFKEPQ
ncbi:PREDICTED: polyamine-modulated factor 1-like [Pygoscelis adeliae]|uniref:polyamine-modulated factor 1-like n=1 Tax=Pygoscelis adeliae TaxID=9238 RepID=UPI0004F500EE|nr:PREDICTED: polyamine-modulated factor 1-like [Pygoscelis adeliae]